MNGNELENDSLPFALAHLSMIAQAAQGTYRPQPGEIEKRWLWLMAFLRTGQCGANETDRELVQLVQDFITRQTVLSTLAEPAAA